MQRLRPRQCTMAPARHSPGGMLPPSPADKDNVVRARQQHGEYMRTLGSRRRINRGSSGAYLTSSSTKGRLHCNVPETAKPVDAPVSAPVRAQWRTHAQSSDLLSSYEVNIAPTWYGVSTKGFKHAKTCRSRRPAARSRPISDPGCATLLGCELASKLARSNQLQYQLVKNITFFNRHLATAGCGSPAATWWR